MNPNPALHWVLSTLVTLTVMAGARCHSAESAASPTDNGIINAQDFKNPAISNCLAVFTFLEPWPTRLTGVSLSLKQAGAHVQASGYDALGTACAALAAKCSELYKLETLRQMVTGPEYRRTADAVVFGAYADLELIIQSILAAAEGPAFKSFNPEQITDLKGMMTIARQVRTVLVQPASARFSGSTKEMTWEQFVQGVAGKGPASTAAGTAAQDPASKPGADTTSPDPVKKNDPNGAWTWTVQTDRGPGATSSAEFSYSGNKLTGSMKTGRLMRSEIQDAQFDGDRISFTYMSRPDAPSSTRYSGKMSGDTIEGKVELLVAGAVRYTFPWQAFRVGADGTNAAAHDSRPIDYSNKSPKELEYLATHRDGMAQYFLGLNYLKSGSFANAGAWMMLAKASGVTNAVDVWEAALTKAFAGRSSTDKQVVESNARGLMSQLEALHGEGVGGRTISYSESMRILEAMAPSMPLRDAREESSRELADLYRELGWDKNAAGGALSPQALSEIQKIRRETDGKISALRLRYNGDPAASGYIGEQVQKLRSVEAAQIEAIRRK